MRVVLFLVVGLPSAIACGRNGAPPDNKTAATRQQLVGTWRETGAQAREYILDGSGTFSMKISLGACTDGSAAEHVSASGHWSVPDESTLVLDVKTASDPILSNSTMRDAIRELDPTTLVLESSVVGCSGQRMRLSKQ